MPAAPVPLNEQDRLKALRAYDVLDSVGEQALDDIVTIAGEVCGTPMAAVTLIDEFRQVLVSTRGMERGETSRQDAFCAHTILTPAPLVVHDAAQDSRFADNPFVLNNPHIRFYAGAPLITPEGHELGALCVIDREPRALSPGQLVVLEALARQVVTIFELKKTSHQLADALARARLLADLLPVCAWCRKVRNDKDYWVSVERYLKDQAGAVVTHGICPDCAATKFE